MCVLCMHMRMRVSVSLKLFGLLSQFITRVLLITCRFDHVLDSLRYEFFIAESCPASRCPDGTYYDSSVVDENARCRPCGEGCATCVGPSSSGTLTFSHSKFFFLIIL